MAVHGNEPTSSCISISQNTLQVGTEHETRRVPLISRKNGASARSRPRRGGLKQFVEKIPFLAS